MFQEKYAEMQDYSLYDTSCVLHAASKLQIEVIFNNPGHPLHVGPLSDVALCLFVSLCALCLIFYFLFNF